MEASKSEKTRALFERIDDERRKVLVTLPMGVQEKLDEFFRSIPDVRFLDPDGKPNEEWNLFHEKTWYAAGFAAGFAARHAAVSNAGGMGALASAMVAQLVRVAGRKEAVIAASNAASDIAMNAPQDECHYGMSVICDFAKDAGLYARYLVFSDINLPEKDAHWKHAQARMEVWQKGYALAGGGLAGLYVYSGKPSTGSLARR